VILILILNQFSDDDLDLILNHFLNDLSKVWNINKFTIIPTHHHPTHTLHPTPTHPLTQPALDCRFYYPERCRNANNVVVDCVSFERMFRFHVDLLSKKGRLNNIDTSIRNKLDTSNRNNEDTPNRINLDKTCIFVSIGIT
jgi:hypothetical protein